MGGTSSSDHRQSPPPRATPQNSHPPPLMNQRPKTSPNLQPNQTSKPDHPPKLSMYTHAPLPIHCTNDTTTLWDLTHSNTSTVALNHDLLAKRHIVTWAQYTVKLVHYNSLYELFIWTLYFGCDSLKSIITSLLNVHVLSCKGCVPYWMAYRQYHFAFSKVHPQIKSSNLGLDMNIAGLRGDCHLNWEHWTTIKTECVK